MFGRFAFWLMVFSVGLPAGTQMPDVRAATVHLSLVADPATKSWDAFLAIDDPAHQTLGLAGIEFQVTASGGLAIVNSVNRLPVATETDDFSTFFQKGFTLVRSDGQAGADIRAAQGLFNTLSSTGSGNNGILEGVGKGPLVETNGLLPSTTVAPLALIASGTFTGEIGALRIAGSPASTTLLPAALPAAGAPITTFSPDAVWGDEVVLVPEPCAGALALLGLAGLVAWRRRTASQG